MENKIRYMTEDEEIEKKWDNKIYMLHENERWLNEQAEKGLLLKNFDKESAYFMEAAAEHIKYKIVILNNNRAENQIKIIEHQGFTFIGSYDQHYIFYIDRKYGHIQPRLNEEMIQFAGKWLNKQMIKSFGLSIIGFIPILLNLIFGWDKLLQTIVEMPTVWYVFCGFFITVSMIDGIRVYRAVRNTKKCLLESKEYLFDRSSKQSKIIKNTILVIIVLGGVLLIADAYFDEDQQSIADVQKVMPIVLLQDIEQEEEESEILKGSKRIISEDNYAEIEQMLFAPKQYRAWQKNSQNRMRIQYYEVVVKKLAEPLARELSASHAILKIKKDDLKKVDYDGLDAVYIWQDRLILNVSVCKGNKVMFICNIGDMQLEDILREMEEVL